MLYVQKSVSHIPPVCTKLVEPLWHSTLTQTHAFHDAGANPAKSAAKSAARPVARPAAMPAAKPQFSFDIADDRDGAADEGGSLDDAHGATAHGRQTTPYTHQQQLSHPAAAPGFNFDIDDDIDDDFDHGGSTAQRNDRVASNQHASTSASADTAAPSAAAAVPAAQPSSAMCMQRPLAPKLQASSHEPSAARSQPGFQSGSGGPFQKSWPAVMKAQQPQLRKAPNSFKPPRRIMSASAAAAGAEAANGAADKEAEVGSRMGGASSRQPLLRLRRAGQAAPHAVPHDVPQAVGKVQGNKEDGAQQKSCLTVIRVVSLDIILVTSLPSTWQLICALGSAGCCCCCC